MPPTNGVIELINELTPFLTEQIPEELQNGVLYISIKYETAIHLCCCGCGNETVTPFGGEKDWTLMEKNDLISLTPSIGNYNFPCRSHYYITENKVIWF